MKPASLSQLRHDLRTPLNQIIGYSELLIEDTDQAHHRDLSHIHTAANHLLRLIEENFRDNSSADESKPVSSLTASVAEERMVAAPESVFRPTQLSSIKGRILVVDDESANAELLARHLQRQGHVLAICTSGTDALRRLLSESFDLVLLDLLMPELDGYGTLREMKADMTLRHVPVIMISALDELDSVIHCIEAGAEDYLTKPYNPTLLRARIEACLEKKAFRDQEQLYLSTIERTQKRLQMELTDAENYIRSILPAPSEKTPPVDWRLYPSTELGGDSFGYHWIDDDHFALYLLDVCGHGVGAALLSVAAINVLRSSSLPEVDFRDPGAVLTALNRAFPMEKQNNLYFTIWYGVWKSSERLLRFASAGHPPAILVPPPFESRTVVELLKGAGPVIGALPEIHYVSEKVIIPEKSRLYIVSDGTFEVTRPDGTFWPYKDYLSFFTKPKEAGASELDRLLEHVKAMRGSSKLDDDFTILRCQL